MRITTIHYGVLLLTGVMLATSCVDDKYDLSDIDTTTAIKLKDLVLPVNLEEITLDQVLKVDEDDPDDPIKIVDGYYVIQKGGTFTADDVTVDMLDATDNTLVPTLPLVTGTSGTEIMPATTNFSYKVKDVDESLKSLSYLQLDAKAMKVTLTMTPSDINYNNVKIQIPEGYNANYKGVDYVDGIIPVTIENGVLDEPFYITSMDFTDPLYPQMVDYDGVLSNTLDITGPIGFAAATLDAPYSGSIYADFVMHPFTANIASGTILYTIDDPEIDPVNLDDLPDFLTEGETKLILTNPQLYLNFPAMYGAKYTGQLAITPTGPGTQPLTPFYLEEFPINLVVAAVTSNLGLIDEYPNPVIQGNSDLSYVIYGDGLPENISFKLTDTRLQGDIDNFELGQNITVEGKYTFFAPLAFDAGSQILYTKSETDFFGDDMEDVEVEELQISANASTKLPFSVELVVYPLDKNGNKIPSQKGGYIVASSTLSPNATNEKLDIHFTESFKGLDGVEFDITADDMQGVTLTPEQTVTLTNIRAKVTGEYVTKL